ncbi:hypothetical protein QF037_000180 [Streptomyces canus]|uniref:hypothetical protein n=1 Tax=Streptomyces canus TaxID=58343 RepID=UPI00278513EC|nr:hypothetical protein [Streptomyces canus]MDQ0595835.1 hypothetical protein [Streptomyces canus]
MDSENTFGLKKAMPDEVSRRCQLAEQVRQDLSASGLTVHRTDERGVTLGEGGGLKIELDDFDDAGGGVWLHWQLHTRTQEGVRAALQRGQADDPLLKAASQTYRHMATAIIAMLTTLGYKAEHSRDDYRPHAVRVIAHPDIHVR